MGMFDMVVFKNTKNETVQIQFKNGERVLDEYHIGDAIDLKDAMYFGHEGAFVVFEGKIVAAFDAQEQFMINKWNNPIQYPDILSTFKGGI
jgi:hypothetical protein